MAQLQFNAQQHTPATDFEIMPAGWYQAVIDESEIKPTSTGGKMLVLRFSIIDGFAKGQKTWKRLNIENANQKAVNIAFSELSAICGACGFQGIDDSSQLHNVPMNVKLKVNPAKGDFEASNEAKAWKHMNEVVTYATPPTAPTAPAQQQQAQGFGNQAPAQQAPAGQGIQQPAQQQQVQQQVQQNAPVNQAQPNQAFDANTAPAQQWQQPAQGQVPVQQQQQQQPPVEQQPVQQQVQQQTQPVQQQAQTQQVEQQAPVTTTQTTPAWAQNK